MKNKQTKWLSAVVARLDLPWLPPCSFHVPHTRVSSQTRYPPMLLSFHCHLFFSLSAFISIQLLPYSNQATLCNLLVLATLLRLGNSSGGDRLCLPIPSMAVFVFNYLLNITSKYRNMVYAGLNDLCYSNLSIQSLFMYLSLPTPLSREAWRTGEQRNCSNSNKKKIT